ncbi:hypothetical protein AS156_36295 [Bradyrhizobium macuxiense]|uniref:Uncharacterized protein n=1 Tax=Bradyrhizobium macuxiense TaxID=1755647 RepID=A0A109JZY8_9BRAD|nr:hypothetical protein AS156_36295 [Bradyrhizobium macuxiense]
MNVFLDVWSDDLDDLDWVDITNGNYLNIAAPSVGEISQARHPDSPVTCRQSVTRLSQHFVQKPRNIIRRNLAGSPERYLSLYAWIDHNGHGQDIADDVIHDPPNISIDVVQTDARAIGGDR